jgi:CBS domain-containing protein
LAPEDLSAFHIEEKTQMTVRDLMTPIIFKVDENTPIQDVADVMLGGRIHRLLVTRGEQIVGIVTTMDMLKVIKEAL